MPNPNDTTVAALHERLSKLELDFDALLRGLSEMNGTLGAHTELLNRILDAANAEIPDSGLGEKLDRIADALERQDALFRDLQDGLTGLPRAIAEAVHGPG